MAVHRDGDGGAAMRINGNFRRASFVAGLTMALTLAVPAAAFGIWLSDGDGSTGATATSVNKASKPSVVSEEGSVAITWDRSTLASGDFVGYYVVLRDGNWVCSSTDVEAATASCVDPDPVGQEVTYRVVAGIGANWAGPASDGTLFTYDSTAPDAPSAPDLIDADDTGSSDSDNVTSKSSVTVTGTAEPGSTVRVYRGEEPLGEGIADGGEYSVGITLVEGENEIHATATDAAGNVSTSSSVTILLSDSQIAMPSAPDLIATDDTGASDTDNLTTKSSVTVTGTAEAGSTVKISRGATLLGSGTAIGGTYSIVISLVEGENEIHAIATDAAGNVSGSSSATLILRDTQVAAPSTPDMIAADDSGSSNADNITNKTSVLVTGTAEAGSTVRIYRGVTQVGSGVATEGNYSISVTLVEGPNPLLATATDAAGNVSGNSGTLAVTLDTLAPTVTMQYPTSSSTINNGQWGNNCGNAAPSGVGAAGLCGYVNGTGSSVVTIEYELRATAPSPNTCFNEAAYAAANCDTWRSVTQNLTGPSSNERRWGISMAFGTVASGLNELRVKVVDVAGNSNFGSTTAGTATVKFTKS